MPGFSAAPGLGGVVAPGLPETGVSVLPAGTAGLACPPSLFSTLGFLTGRLGVFFSSWPEARVCAPVRSRTRTNFRGMFSKPLLRFIVPSKSKFSRAIQCYDQLVIIIKFLFIIISILGVKAP